MTSATMTSVAMAQEHWAFVPPRRPAVPIVSGQWAKNDVDRFVQAALEAAGLAVSEQAPRGQLLRRVTLDLTGLPPTNDDLAAFEGDARVDAYERVVDLLLRSPAAAEESTRLWLDLSRYADTHGMQRDQVRALWRWRDWVIDAYATNMPYDRFVSEQLAGDLLPNATTAQQIASGWNRNNPTSDEGGLIPEEYLARYAMNRTDTFGTAMLGLTVGCAQCHDHKSDPLTQRDYYRLLAYFASFDEQGNDGGALAAAPFVVAPLPEQVAELARLQAALAAGEAAFAAVRWALLPFASESADVVFERRDDGSLLAVGPAPLRADYTLGVVAEVAGLRALRLTALPDAALPARGPGRANNGNFVLGEVEVEVEVGDAGAKERVVIASVDAEFAQSGHDAGLVIDGDATTGWAVNGRHEPTALHLHFAQPLPTGARSLRIVLRHQSAHAQHLLGRFVVHGSAADLGGVLSRRRTATAQLAEFSQQLPLCMVSRERAEPRPVHVLTRGRYDQPGERVAAQTPAFLPPLSTDAPTDRRALAAWLFAPQQPLTARVAVNRIWLRHFGRGLVATAHDFGKLGAKPSHPELLDWLACEFIEHGFDERYLHRLLVTSATYRQSCHVSPAGRERDADNVWLARMSRGRLPAEAIRDQALVVSDLMLAERVGGASVKIQQPPGIWEAVAFPGSNTERYVADVGEQLRRRSLYTFWKRSAPPPLLTTFDAPSREMCVIERQVTNTPLQVLALWNDEGMVAATQAFALRCMQAKGDERARVEWAFRCLLQRTASEAEQRVCAELLATPNEAAWTMLASTLLSLDEALHRN